jgi:translation elongation factor EF-4
MVDSELNYELSIVFNQTENLSISTKTEHVLFLTIENIIGDFPKFKGEEISSYLKDIFSKSVLGEYLDDILIELNTGQFTDEIKVAVTLSGKEFIVNNLIYKSIEEGKLSLKSYQLACLL